MIYKARAKISHIIRAKDPDSAMKKFLKAMKKADFELDEDTFVLDDYM